MNQRLKVGLVGIGEVAQVVHLPTLAMLSHLYEVVSVCDVSPGALAHVQARFNVPHATQHLEELLAQDGLDLVMVLNSDEYHAEVAVAAAASGKHVFIEKPAALTHRDLQAIIAAQDAYGVRIMIGYMRRYATAFVQAVQHIRAMDKILYVRVRDIIGPNAFFVEQSGAYPQRFDDVAPAQSADRQARAAAQVHEAVGDDSRWHRPYRFLAGLGSHDLSLMREALGMPQRVLAASKAGNGMFLNALFAYEGFNVNYETGIDANARFDALIEVVGETCTLRIEYDTPYVKGLPVTLTFCETIDGIYQERKVRPTFVDPYTLELEYLHNALTTGAPIKTDLQDAQQDLELFDLLIDALKRG
ncbi:Gfo/Idh/MocA family oxidoreductase [Pseudomonas silvicola]|nr:Gfo/Idh/MocA family oxidoreductase [Pseudomonas silvicola]